MVNLSSGGTGTLSCRLSLREACKAPTFAIKMASAHSCAPSLSQVAAEPNVAAAGEEVSEAAFSFHQAAASAMA